MKYRKKPVVIDAIQWNGWDKEPVISEVKPLPSNVRERIYYKANACGWIETLEGGHIVEEGDWIIRGVAGEFYPCKPDIFEQTYEEVL